MTVLLGILLHLLGGFASGSFYIPYKKVKGWAWESYWIVGGLFSWLFMPWLVAYFTVPHLFDILLSVDSIDIFWPYLMGILWGIGGLTFGLTMRYLGMSLGMAIALGFCSLFGTIIPPVYEGRFSELLQTSSGLAVLTGIGICILGIFICGRAGMRKEKEVPEKEKQDTIKEFNFVKGLTTAIFSGIMSSCMAFGINAGRPIAEQAVKFNVDPLWQNSAVLIVVLAGGLTTNFLWCIILNFKNRTGKDYVNNATPLFRNYFFSFLAGTLWYLQFMFYGMGTTKMGKYDFSSWTLHMAFIIVFSTMWGLVLREWKGSSKKTLFLVILGIGIVILSTVFIGIGSYWSSQGK